MIGKVHKEDSQPLFQRPVYTCRSREDKYSARNVIICIPPYTKHGESLNYLSEVDAACDLCTPPDVLHPGEGTDSQRECGKILLISSTAVYGDGASGNITENTPIEKSSASQRVIRYVIAHVDFFLY